MGIGINSERTVLERWLLLATCTKGIGSKISQLEPAKSGAGGKHYAHPLSPESTLSFPATVAWGFEPLVLV